VCAGTASTHGNDFVKSVLTNENGKAIPEFRSGISRRRKEKNNFGFFFVFSALAVV
jgi:hypothetical protein